MYYKCTKFYENREAVFQKTKIFYFFLMWTTLHFKGRSKKNKRKKERKGQTVNICKGTPDIEFEQDWSVGLGVHYVTDRKLKTIFLLPRIFPGKADSVILLGFECTINPQNLIKIVWAIFEKFEFFFLCELPLILRVGGKLNKRLEISTWVPYI